MSTEQARMEPVTHPDSQAVAPDLQAVPELSAGSTTGTKTTDPVLVDELREFGKQIEGLFQTARSSTRGKELEAQLTSAWRDVEKGVNDAIAKAQSSDIKGTVQGTTKYAADEAQTGLARGLKSLNTWMAQKRADAEERRKNREAAESAAAVSGTADNQVTDRFGSDQPSFGSNLSLPQVHLPPDPNATSTDNPVSDRFDTEVKL